MSLFNCKDLDHLLAEKLDILDLPSLISLSLSNKYYYTLLNDTFYRTLYLKKYKHHLGNDRLNHLGNDRLNHLGNDRLNHLGNDSLQHFTKSMYFENEMYLRSLNKSNVSKAKHFAVISDRVDLLIIILSSFPLINDYSLYMDLAIEKDSISCFSYLFNNKNNIQEYYIDASIRHKSDKILTYLFERGYVKYTATRFDICFHHYSSKFIELYLVKMSEKKDNMYFSSDLLEEIVYKLCYPYNDNSSWAKQFNMAFALFAKTLTRDQVKTIQEVCLSRDRYTPIKLITAYTSFFKPFSK